ncbi:hypothetical protein [Actinoplanes sp. HUAS TT8]|uniref:hypothetical protein n=1 Tax=Actinoplanes sp. HUAS TT8 TaxID=3447453 RepID=UPI003F52691B
MSFVRRLALGLPVAGVTAFAALTIASPALAAADAAQAAHPVVAASPDRGNTGYGNGELPSPPTTPPTTGVVTTTPPPAVTPSASVSPDTTGATRGHPGYSASISAGPSGGAQSVPGNGVNHETVPSPSESVSSTPQVSSGSLPLTGGPVGATVGVGAVLVAAGAGALWYTRRRKTA